MKEYNRPLVLKSLTTTDPVLLSMKDRFNRVNRPFINKLVSEVGYIWACIHKDMNSEEYPEYILVWIELEQWDK